MAISDTYLGYVADQLAAFGPVRVKKMFGGAGLYAGGLIFGIVADDVLYFRVDEHNRPPYVSKGMTPFKPYPDRRTVMPYYEVPADVLETPDVLREWADAAVAAARRAARTRSARARRPRSGRPRR